MQKYLFRAVRNATLNLMRREARERRKREARSASKRRIFAIPGEREEELRALNTAVLQLGPEQREVVILKVWGELTFREIGELLDLPMNTAASRYRYAVEKLREAMGDYYGE
jgi:RNA polymerase sigma-70 factor (ECF subfamily)